MNGRQGVALAPWDAAGAPHPCLVPIMKRAGVERSRGPISPVACPLLCGCCFIPFTLLHTRDWTVCKPLSCPFPGVLVSLAQRTDKLVWDSQLLGCLRDLCSPFAPSAPATLASLLSHHPHTKLAPTSGPLHLLFLLPWAFFLPPGPLPRFIQASAQMLPPQRHLLIISSVVAPHTLFLLPQFLRGAHHHLHPPSSMYVQTVGH